MRLCLGSRGIVKDRSTNDLWNSSGPGVVTYFHEMIVPMNWGYDSLPDNPAGFGVESVKDGLSAREGSSKPRDGRQ